MFTAITWKTFWIITSIAVIGWYVSVLLWSYKGMLKSRLFHTEQNNSSEDLELDWNNKGNQNESDAFPETDKPTKETEDELTDELFELAGQLTQRIDDLIRVAQGESYSKTALVNSLTTLIQQYPTLHTPAFRAAINNKIKMACSHHKVHRLREEDLAAVWAT